MPTKSTTPILLVVDDEPNIAYTIEATLSSPTLRVVAAATAQEGIDAVRGLRPSVVLLDIRLPDMSGLEAFRRIHEIDPRIPVVIMTAFATADTAVEAMRSGALDYFVKPVDLTALRNAVKKAIEVSRLSHVPAIVEVEETSEADRIVGRSPAMQEVYKAIGRVAHQDVTVLLLGESGTGKELVARAIYHYSRRAQQPFLAINCAALSESLLESELFGHEKGAFTGADSRRIGKFEQVNGGTIFLDEIGDMSPSTQSKALRLLQQQEFERVGGNVTVRTDVRIIAATNKDLAALVAEGKFRQDLFYRLSGFTLRLPPLRDRKEDVPLLTDYFIRQYNGEFGKAIRGVTDETRQVLQQHSWPGNIRELNNVVRYAVVHSTGEAITSDCLPESCSPNDVCSPHGRIEGEEAGIDLPDIRRFTQQRLVAGSTDIYRELAQHVDRVVLDEVLRASRGNQFQAAERLGISRVTLRAKLRSLNVRSAKEETGE